LYNEEEKEYAGQRFNREPWVDDDFEVRLNTDNNDRERLSGNPNPFTGALNLSGGGSDVRGF